MKYDDTFKLKIIKEIESKKGSISHLAKTEKIPRQTLSRWVSKYRKGGQDELKNKKVGAKEKPISEGFENLVLDKWKKRKRSAYMMRKDLRKEIIPNGHEISERQIKRIYDKYALKT